MADHDQGERDPVLSQAYRADQVVTSAIASSAELRERILTAALAQAARGAGPAAAVSEAPARALSPRGVLGVVVGVALIAGAVGYVVGRRVPAATEVRALDAWLDAGRGRLASAPLDARPSDMSALLDASPADPIAPLDASPAVATAPLDAGLEAGSAVTPDPATARPVRRARTGGPRRAQDSAEMNEPLLIDQARAALRRGLVDDAIAALDRHQREFASGQLVEEREALLIEADLVNGDVDAARARIERYRQRYPRGLLRDYVESLAPVP